MTAHSCNRIVHLASQLFQAPVAFLTVTDGSHHDVRAQVGIPTNCDLSDGSLCRLAIGHDQPTLVIPEPELSSALSQHPLVIGAPFLRFYAAATLTDGQGRKCGALCVLDTLPRPYPTASELSLLEDLAKFASQVIELEAARRDLSEKERLLTMAESMSGVGHWRYEIKSGKITWSPEVYKFFGIPVDKEALSLQDALARYPAEDRLKVEEAIVSAIATGKGYSFERKLLGYDGILRTTRSSAVCEIGPEGQVEALFGVFQDVTDHVAALEVAHAATDAKAEFLANMSHELRTPLTSVIGYAGLLRDLPNVDGETTYYVDQVLSASNTLMTTINDVLDFSKLESGQFSIDIHPVSIRSVVSEVVSLFGPQADTKELSIITNIQDSVPYGLLLDRDRIRQVLINLVSNALRFTMVGGVEIGVAFDGKELTLEVKDSGCGIAPDKLSLLFQRFSQIDGSSRRTNNGTGLGLAISKGIVEAMKGNIRVTSVAGRGSCFTVLIPTEPVDIDKKSKSCEPSRIDLKDYRILLVDDCGANRQLVTDILRPTGAKLAVARDGDEAVRASRDDFFDLVLLDLHMPRMDGLETAKCLRRDDRRSPPIPIIAFSADSIATEEIFRGRDSAYFDGAITKPVLPRTLVTTVAAVLGVANGI